MVMRITNTGMLTKDSKEKIIKQIYYSLKQNYFGEFNNFGEFIEWNDLNNLTINFRITDHYKIKHDLSLTLREHI